MVVVDEDVEDDVVQEVDPAVRSLGVGPGQTGDVDVEVEVAWLVVDVAA